MVPGSFSENLANLLHSHEENSKRLVITSDGEIQDGYFFRVQCDSSVTHYNTKGAGKSAAFYSPTSCWLKEVSREDILSHNFWGNRDPTALVSVFDNFSKLSTSL